MLVVTHTFLHPFLVLTGTTEVLYSGEHQEGKANLNQTVKEDLIMFRNINADTNPNHSRNRGYSSSYRSQRRNQGIGFGIVVFLLIVIGGGVGVAAYANTSTEVACVVTDKDRTRGSEGGSDMRVYTDNCGVFQVKDNLLKGHFKSSDVYNDIEVGQTYDFTTFGFRVPILSSFKSILTATPTAG